MGPLMTMVCALSMAFFERVTQISPSALEALQSLSLQSPQDAFSTPTQLDGDLITLTLLPRSRWQTLLNLEVIQVM